jgi:hypothetical protein
MSTPQKRPVIADPSFYDRIVSKTKRARRQLRVLAAAEQEAELAELEPEILESIDRAAGRGEREVKIDQPTCVPTTEEFRDWVSNVLANVCDGPFDVDVCEDQPDMIVISWLHDQTSELF